MKRIVFVIGVLALVNIIISAAFGADEKKPDRKAKVTIKREDDKVVLEGVKNWFVGDKESSMQAAMESIMQALGEDVKYDYLVGVSGLAFRMQVYKKGLCPSSPHPACGYQCFDRSFKSLPWEMKSYQAKAEETEKVKEIRKLIVESIDKGIPVQYGSEEDGVIIGYQKNGDEWICYHPIKGKDGKSFIETDWPWGIGIYANKKKKMRAKKDLIIESLQQAVEMAITEDSGEYYVGFKAWGEYIKELNRIAAGDDKLRADSMLGNAWIYECLVQYRLVAAKYLRDFTGDRDNPIFAHLNKAAEYYENMASKILTDDKHEILAVTPYPFSLKEGEKWTPEMIKAQVTRLEKALPLEHKAIEEISKALELFADAKGNQEKPENNK
jgi:hypothetical protein